MRTLLGSFAFYVEARSEFLIFPRLLRRYAALGGEDRLQFLPDLGDGPNLRQPHPVAMHIGVVHRGLARRGREPDAHVHIGLRLLEVFEEHVARVLFGIHHAVELSQKRDQLLLHAGMRLQDRHGTDRLFHRWGSPGSKYVMTILYRFRPGPPPFSPTHAMQPDEVG